VCAQYFSTLALALAGESKRARAMADSALAAARGLNDPFTLALALAFASVMAQLLGDVALATRHAEVSRQIAIEHDLAMPKAWSTGVLGWCAAEAGDPTRGVVLLTESIAALQAAYSRHFLSYQLGLLADVQMRAGHHADALAAVENALAFADAGGERYYAAELHRLQGELLARPPYGDRRKAEASFRAAIKIAGQQGARALQRKADASLRRWCA
jgi:adenylate cyclase